jgi:hypothetical protein
MATRASLTTLINTNLNTGTSITAAEHRAVEIAIVDSCKPYNAGYFTLGDAAPTGSTGTLTVSGALSATASVLATNTSKIVVVFNTATPMPNTNYYVRLFVQGLSVNPNQDSAISTPIFANQTTTQFEVYVKDNVTTTQNIRIYFEAIPLD